MAALHVHMDLHFFARRTDRIQCLGFKFDDVRSPSNSEYLWKCPVLTDLHALRPELFGGMTGRNGRRV